MATATLYQPTPAMAQLGGIFGAVLGAVGGLAGQRAPRGRVVERRGRASRTGRSAETASRGNQDTNSAGDKATPSKDRVLATLAVPSRVQMAVLKSIVPAAALGVVGSTDDLNPVGQTTSRDEERDYTKIISNLIAKFNKSEQRQRASGEGDITEHAVLQAVDDAYQRIDLARFSTFNGENWSLERLRVLILEKVSNEADSMLHGTNKGRVSMSDLRGVINKSADVVYQRLFETSELLAANRSSNQFVQLLYQAQGDATFGEVREGAERMLMRAASKVKGPFDDLIRRDPRNYTLNYRKQRIVFDCLSENIVSVSSAVQGIATLAEIDDRIGTVATQVCKTWLSAQFVSQDNKLVKQEPMPLRTIWSESGPIDDASMYTPQSNAL